MKSGRVAAILALFFMIFAWDGQAVTASQIPFDEWLRELRAEALERGIREETLDAALTGVEPIPRVIELDQQQPEFTLTFQQYRDRVVPRTRIEMGRQRLAEHHELLTEIGNKLGVQPRFIVALWGIETDFGRITGGFPVIASLATLAHDGRRSAYFRRELFNALQILDEGHITPDRMVGSWAGAMGQSQFMPSSFLNFAVDYDGDGRRDIWQTQADVFASAANYLARSGWLVDQTWGRAVRLPSGFNRDLTGLDTRKPIGQWQALGVRQPDGSALPTRQLSASIIIPDPENSPELAFMVYENFRTILKWNRSNYFALAVGLLSDAIAE
ncbi:MAG TPA: lytic murein transglycosylase [Desulfurivibrio alkaliphilus]|uniref:Lytic murein transglycosylase n=1 Tax=Desulfurivibrio alkaliphilus TaxID=427923 RepID=A0A7C2XHJ4_9BACT|nr:lytic murein transglycosylase [Desulfurivibrio alkaliphilus]